MAMVGGWGKAKRLCAHALSGPAALAKPVMRRRKPRRRGRIRYTGVSVYWRESGSARFGVRLSTRRIPPSESCHTALRHGVPGPGPIDCGQLPRSRPTLSELSSELLSKSVRFESDVGAVEQAAQLLTSDIRIHSGRRPVKPFRSHPNMLQCHVLPVFTRLL
jgi:hypothetical protein